MIDRSAATALLLLIDPDDSVRDAFAHHFCEPGVQLLAASRGAEGLNLVRRHRPGAVVLEANLPDLPGLEVCRRIHEFDNRIPVILVAHGLPAQTAIEAMKHGAFDYLSKPLTFARVDEVVASAL